MKPARTPRKFVAPVNWGALPKGVYYRRMGQQAGIDGLFCKRQIERIRAHLRRFACQRDIDLVGDRAAFKVDFRAEVANLKQVKTIHFRQPRLELLLQRLTVINTFWERAPVSHQVNVSLAGEPAQVRADPLSLPFAEKSVDACLLAHTLPWCPDPHRLLQEVDRVLIDDGWLVMSGFNPISLLGACKALCRRLIS